MELTFQVLPGVCAGCGACLRTCPEHAVRPGPATITDDPDDPDDPDATSAMADTAAGSGASAVSGVGDVRGVPRRAPVVLAYLCTGCGECMEVCPVDAIEEVAGRDEALTMGAAG